MFSVILLPLFRFLSPIPSCPPSRLGGTRGGACPRMEVAREHNGPFHYTTVPTLRSSLTTYTRVLNASGWGSLLAHHSWDRTWQPEGPQSSSEGSQLYTLAQATDMATLSDFVRESPGCPVTAPHSSQEYAIGAGGTCLWLLSGRDSKWSSSLGKWS